LIIYAGLLLMPVPFGTFTGSRSNSGGS